MRANSFPRVQFVQIVQRCVQFVQTVPANLVHSSPRPATGNQAKIDIDPLSCLHRWNSSPKIPTEQKYSNHRQNGKPDVDGRETFQLPSSLSSQCIVQENEIKCCQNMTSLVWFITLMSLYDSLSHFTFNIKSAAGELDMESSWQAHRLGF